MRRQATSYLVTALKCAMASTFSEEAAAFIAPKKVRAHQCVLSMFDGVFMWQLLIGADCCCRVACCWWSMFA